MTQLLGVCVLERDTHKNVLMAWQYPEVDADVESVALARWTATLDSSDPASVVVSRYKTVWLYTATRKTDALSEDKFPKQVAAVAVCVLADAFLPARFSALATCLLTHLASAGHPLALLQCYLGVFCRGKYGDFELGATVEATSGIRDVLARTFGEESVLLWVALVTKKRVAFVAQDTTQLLALGRALRALVPHRSSDGAAWLWPFVAGTPAELADVRSAGVYCAGFVDGQVVAANTEMFDVVADMAAQSVVVTATANADDFTLCKLHKDVATVLTSAVDDSASTDAAVEDGLALRMRSIVERLESLRGTGQFVTAESIRAQVQPPLDRFLLAVAQAEGMTPTADAAPDTTDQQQQQP